MTGPSSGAEMIFSAARGCRSSANEPQTAANRMEVGKRSGDGQKKMAVVMNCQASVRRGSRAVADVVGISVLRAKSTRISPPAMSTTVGYGIICGPVTVCYLLRLRCGRALTHSAMPDCLNAHAARTSIFTHFHVTAPAALEIVDRLCRASNETIPGVLAPLAVSAVVSSGQ